MSLRTKLLVAVGLLVAVLAAVVAGFWFFFLRSSSPPPVSLQAALTSQAVITPAPSTGTSTATAPTGLTGTWSIASGSGSFVGYRVDEQLASIGANTAVGRTSNVQGTLVYDGSSITSVQISADLTTLTSDKSQRDGTLRMQGLQTSRYPTATFALTAPVPIDGTPQEDATVTKTIQGDLTLHGVTRPVSIDVQGQLQSGKLVVVGSTNITFADFSISPPSSFQVLSVEDHGTMQFQLIFSKA